MKSVVFTLVACLLPGIAPLAHASERRFTYTYQSLVLNAGDIELEPWTTFRHGRSDYYNRFDQRLELEIGLTDRLQMAWYLNFTGLVRDEGEERVGEFTFKGISSEWKYKLLDPVADFLGLALYLELGAGPEEVEFEGKVIADRQLGNWLVAANLVGELELELEKEETEKEVIIELDLGLGYFITSAFFVGAELRNHNEIIEGEFEHSSLFAGPTVSYAASRWWAALTVLPQVAAIKGSSAGSVLQLDEHERVEARVLLGFHL